MHAAKKNQIWNIPLFQKSRNTRHKIYFVCDNESTDFSITIDDVVYVIDSGKLKLTRYDSQKNINSLEDNWVSHANAKQRAGRAGR